MTEGYPSKSTIQKTKNQLSENQRSEKEKHMLDWNTPLYFIDKGEIFELHLSDFEERAMLPREHGVDFRYFADEDSEGVWWVMKVPVQGARPIRISQHESEEEAQQCAQNYCLNMAYDKALEEGAFESEFDAQQFLLENQ